MHSLLLVVVMWLTVSSVGFVAGDDGVEVKLAVTQAAQPLLTAALTAYTLQRPDVTVTAAYVTSGVAQQKFLGGEVDSAIVNSASVLTPSQQAQYDDVLQVPFYSLQQAITYNLPRDVDLGPLVFSLPLLARIFSANVTFWDDAAIAADNPLYVGKFSHVPIRVVMGDTYTRTGQAALCDVFGRVDADFSTRFPCNSATYLPPLASYSTPPAFYKSSRELAQSLAQHPYSIGYTTLSEASTNGAQIASVINQAGNAIYPSTLSASLPALEVGLLLIDGIATLSTATGPFVWPFTEYMYIQISLTENRKTCAIKKEAVTFLLWLLESDIGSQIGNLQASPILLPSLQTQLGIGAALRSVACLPGAPVVSTELADSMLLIGADTLTSSMNNLLPLYTFSGSDSGPKVWTPAVRDIALESVESTTKTGTQDTVNDAAFVLGTDTVDDPSLMSLPFATLSARLLYSLPRGLNNSLVSTIILDLETVAQIFTGEITSWLHPRITRFNRALAIKLMANSALNANITVVLCCSAGRGSTPAIDVLRSSLSATKSWGDSPLSSAIDSFFTWSPVFSSASSLNFLTAPSEVDILEYVLQNPGSIGYILMDEAAYDSGLHVKIMPWQGGDANEITADQLDADGFYAQADALSIAPSSDSAFACIGARPDDSALNTYTATMDWSRTNISSLCWPLTITIQVVVPTSYSNAEDSQHSCDDAQRILSLVGWMLSSPVLSGFLNPLGFATVAQAGSEWAVYLKGQLNSIECDGVFVLVDVPITWALDGAIIQALQAWAGIGIALSGLCAIFLLTSFRRAMIKRAGVRLLMVSCLGACLMFIAAIIWISSPISLSQCVAFNWLSQLGTTCLFLPICLRRWRTDRDLAAARSGLAQKQKGERKSKVNKRMKTTSRKMTAIIALAVVLDIVLLSIMQEHSIGMQLKTFSSGSFTAQDVGTYYTHCTPSSGSAPVYGVMTGVKGLAILWAALLVLGHSQLNSQILMPELKHQSLALYNFLFTSAIVLPIIFLITTYGSGLVVLIDVLLLWSATFAVFAIFAPLVYSELFRTKASTLDTPADTEVYSNRLGPKGVTAGFELPSIVSLDQYQLSTFMLAFDKQIIRAKRRLLLLETSSRPIGASKYVHEGSHSRSRSAIRTTTFVRRGSTSQPSPSNPHSRRPSGRASPNIDSPQSLVTRRAMVNHLHHTPMPPATASAVDPAEPTSPSAVDERVSIPHHRQASRAAGASTITPDPSQAWINRGPKSHARPGSSSHHLLVATLNRASNRLHMTKAGMISRAASPAPALNASTQSGSPLLSASTPHSARNVSTARTRSPSPLSPLPTEIRTVAAPAPVTLHTTT